MLDPLFPVVKLLNGTKFAEMLKYSIFNFNWFFFFYNLSHEREKTGVICEDAHYIKPASFVLMREINPASHSELLGCSKRGWGCSIHNQQSHQREK